MRGFHVPFYSVVVRWLQSPVEEISLWESLPRGLERIQFSAYNGLHVGLELDGGGSSWCTYSHEKAWGQDWLLLVSTACMITPLSPCWHLWLPNHKKILKEEEVKCSFSPSPFIWNWSGNWWNSLDSLICLGSNFAPPFQIPKCWVETGGWWWGNQKNPCSEGFVLAFPIPCQQ